MAQAESTHGGRFVQGNWLLTLAMKAIQCSQSPPSTGREQPDDRNDHGPAATTQPSATAPTIGMTTGAVRTWLRLEGLAAFGIGLALFGASGGNWLLLVPLLLLPDVSAVGFLAGPRIGTFTYNLFHNWVPGIVTLGLGAWLASPADPAGRGDPHRPRRDGPGGGLRPQAAELVPRHASRPDGAGEGVSPARARTSHDDDRGRRPRDSRGRRPRRGHDAGGRRARRRSSSVPVQAVPDRGALIAAIGGGGARRPRPASSSPRARDPIPRQVFARSPRPFGRSPSATRARTSCCS